MRRLGDAFDEIVSVENLVEAHREARKNKRRYFQVLRFEKHFRHNIRKLHLELVNDQWSIFGYRMFPRYDSGKLRIIHWNPSYRDNLVQHAIERVAGKYLTKTLIEDTYAGIKKRGIHKGVKRIIRFLSEYPPDAPIYILKMDVRKYYQNIDHDILKKKLRHKIKDKRVLRLFDIIIDSHAPGLPIGNYLSQLLANYFLSSYDRFVKDSGFRHYSRYCDDIVVLSSDKDKLRDLLRETERKFAELKLSLKPNAQIFPIERYGLDFLGYVFRRGGIVLRKKTERKYRRSAIRFNENPTEKNSRPLSSYWGLFMWLTHGDRLWHRFFDCSYKKLQAKVKTGGKTNGRDSERSSDVLPQRDGERGLPRDPQGGEHHHNPDLHP